MPIARLVAQTFDYSYIICTFILVLLPDSFTIYSTKYHFAGLWFLSRRKLYTSFTLRFLKWERYLLVKVDKVEGLIVVLVGFCCLRRIASMRLAWYGLFLDCFLIFDILVRFLMLRFCFNFVNICWLLNLNYWFFLML